MISSGAESREIHGKTDLAANRGARRILAADQAEGNAEALADRKLPSALELQLRPGQTCGIGERAEKLAAQGQPGTKVVQ